MEFIEAPAELHKIFATAKLTLQRSSVSLRSRYTGKRQSVVLPYALWMFEGKLMKLEPAEAAPVRAFLTRLQGQVNKFALKVPGVDLPVSNYSGPAGRVNGAGQTGRSLETDGWTPNTLVLKQGDYFTVGQELKVCSADVTTSGAGTATVTFEPRMTRPSVDNDFLISREPFVILSAADDSAATWDLSKPVLHDITLKCIEAVD